MKIIFLGTNGWFDTATGNTVSILVGTKTCNIILDAGFGIAKADRYLDYSKPTYILLSHLHLDHIVGLHALAKFKFKQPLIIYVPQGNVQQLKAFIDQPFTVPFSHFLFETRVYAAKAKMRLSGLAVRSLSLKHSSTCMGYRLEQGRKILSYCTDTGICDNLLKLARNANLLITECALRKGQDDQGWPHLDPEHAALLAKEANVSKLVMTHFDADNYRTIKQRKQAQQHAQKIFKASYAAFDGMKIRV